MRERVAQHRANPACASCHNLMDPVGFALEKYDAIGRWRTVDGGTPVDASGVLPDGSKFDGPCGASSRPCSRDLSFLFPQWRKSFLRSLWVAERNITTLPAVRKIVADASGNDYRFSRSGSRNCHTARLFK